MKSIEDQFKGKWQDEQRPRDPQLICKPPISETFAQRSYQRQSWEQLNSVSGELGKCWGKSLTLCHRTLRLRTPCGEPAKPDGLYAALCLSQVVCRANNSNFAGIASLWWQADRSD